MTEYAARQPIIFRAPSSTLDAKAQADLAAAYAAQANVAAQAAAAAAQGRIYADYATGNAATTTGQYFFVAASGSMDLYIHGTATPIARMPKVSIATGHMILGTANDNYLLNAGADNPARGIMADFANTDASPNGALISFSQDGIANWVIGQKPGVSQFGIYVGRNAGADGTALFGIDASGKMTLGTAAFNYMLNVGAANPARGILGDLSNSDASPNGALLSFTQNGINNWCIGQTPGVDAFSIFAGRNGATDGTEIVRITTAAIGPASDNNRTAGTASLRYSVVYAGTGSINTSDANDKDNIGEIPDEWLDAWADVEWSRFKFTGRIRWHVGLVAQQVHAAFAAHDIDAFEIGLCCFDEWEEQGEIPAGSRWGLRYSECEAMEAAYQRRRIAQLEAQVAAL